MTNDGSNSWRKGAHFESEYFLTLTYLPPVQAEERIKGFLFEGGNKSTSDHLATQVLDRFRSRLDVFENMFGSLFRAERLKRRRWTDDLGFQHEYDDLLRYLRRCISGDDHPFALPEIPCFLNDLLACDDFYGGVQPRIGPRHIRVIAIDGFPRVSSPGILRALDTLAIEYRWNTRALLLDADFACRVETINAVEAWRGSLPGDGYSNVRRIILHTLNLADMMPVTSVWAGLQGHPSPLFPEQSAPLLYAGHEWRYSIPSKPPYF
jgi:type IV secretory pathway VirB4 component